MRREADPLITNRIVAKIGEYYQKYGVMFRKVQLDPIPISSTQIRKAVREGKEISHLVPEGVERFIRENGLYREEKGDDRDL